MSHYWGFILDQTSPHLQITLLGAPLLWHTCLSLVNNFENSKHCTMIRKDVLKRKLLTRFSFYFCSLVPDCINDVYRCMVNFGMFMREFYRKTYSSTIRKVNVFKSTHAYKRKSVDLTRLWTNLRYQFDGEFDPQ